MYKPAETGLSKSGGVVTPTDLNRSACTMKSEVHTRVEAHLLEYRRMSAAACDGAGRSRGTGSYCGGTGDDAAGIDGLAPQLLLPTLSPRPR